MAFPIDTSRRVATPELLLEIMELSSFGPQTRAQLAKQLRRAHPLARIDGRLDAALEILAGEGLVEFVARTGERSWRTTQSGLESLERNGRFSDTATVVFTDIVGSTELIEREGETAAHEIRQRHFALLRTALGRHRGHEVKNLGDGLMVVFREAGAAVACARDMQQAVAEDDDGLGLRVGVNSGQLLRDGDDFFGSTVIVARRLCDVAESGQTIVSSSSCELLDGDVPGRTEQLGPVALKGLAESVPAVAFRWSDRTESVVG